MRAEIISIGTELLVGSILNSNARFLSEKLAERGIDVYHQVTVGDNIERLTAALNTALGRADLVLCTGGLGPTADDVTFEAASRALSTRRLFHRPTAKRIRERLRAAGLPSSRLSMNQCHLPEKAVIFQNHHGTAPGILCKTLRGGETRHLALLPGPPSEMEPMFLSQLDPAIAVVRGQTLESFYIRTIKIAGLTETQVAEKLGDLLERKPPVTCGIYAKAGEVQLKVMSKADTLGAARYGAAPIEKIILKTFGRAAFGVDDQTHASVVVDKLKKMRKTLAVAESCTGGLTSHLLTETAGSSAVFYGGVIAYADSVKREILGVSAKTLKKHGAVSRMTALEMARGVRLALDTSIGMAITGIAGPAGGTAQKPVGLVFIALCDARGSWVRECRFIGQRSSVKLKSARKALDLLRLHLSTP